MTERPGHENRVNLYEKTKAKYVEGGVDPSLADRFAQDTRLQSGHPHYEHSGVNRMMIEGQHGDDHRTWLAGEPDRRQERLKTELKNVVKGKPESDPRLNRESEHYLHSGTDRLMVESWHNS